MKNNKQKKEMVFFILKTDNLEQLKTLKEGESVCYREKDLAYELVLKEVFGYFKSKWIKNFKHQCSQCPRNENKNKMSILYGLKYCSKCVLGITEKEARRQASLHYDLEKSINIKRKSN